MGAAYSLMPEDRIGANINEHQQSYRVRFGYRKAVCQSNHHQILCLTSSVDNKPYGFKTNPACTTSARIWFLTTTAASRNAESRPTLPSDGQHCWKLASALTTCSEITNGHWSKWIYTGNLTSRESTTIDHVPNTLTKSRGLRVSHHHERSNNITPLHISEIQAWILLYNCIGQNTSHTTRWGKNCTLFIFSITLSIHTLTW